MVIIVSAWKIVLARHIPPNSRSCRGGGGGWQSLKNAQTFSSCLVLKFGLEKCSLTCNTCTTTPLSLSYANSNTNRLEIILVRTLLEKQSKFQLYNIKCFGKHDTTRNIPRSITFAPLHFMLYRGKLISFGIV